MVPLTGRFSENLLRESCDILRNCLLLSYASRNLEISERREVTGLRVILVYMRSVRGFTASSNEPNRQEVDGN
jgi:hypothetical protein